MTNVKLNNVIWYADKVAATKCELGIQHSFMACLATAINYLTGNLDPVWLMGSSSFAFRIMVNETLCPSAMSVFDWTSILPEAAENAGFQCRYISRLWGQDAIEATKREEAHAALVEGLRQGRPAVVWDIACVEWGLITGFDEEKRHYAALSHRGEPVTLPMEKLGRNGINILSVTIPGERNGRSRNEQIRNSLEAAVRHAEEKEWMDRPKYRDGLPAYDLWALVYDRGVMIVEGGKGGNIGAQVPEHANYYAAHYYSARCYARDYLKAIADGDPHLTAAAECYGRVAASLKTVWEQARNMKSFEDAAPLHAIAQAIRDAGNAEKEGIAAIKAFLG